jgi:hypothetical protein
MPTVEVPILKFADRVNPTVRREEYAEEHITNRRGQGRIGAVRLQFVDFQP